MVENWMILVLLLLELNWMRIENNVMYLLVSGYIALGFNCVGGFLVHEIPWG
jgi:hypothetical protein